MTTRLTASSLANPIIKSVNTTFSAPNPKVVSDVEGPFFIALGKTSKGAIATVNLKSIGDAAAAKTTLILDGFSTDYTFTTKSGAVTVSTIAKGSQKAIAVATLDLTNAFDTPLIKFADLTAKLHAATAKSQATLVILPFPTFTLANDTGVSANDGITSDGTLTISSHPGTKISYSLDGSVNYKDLSGNYYSGASIPLAAGKYAAGSIKIIESVNGSVSKVTSNPNDILVDQTIATPTYVVAENNTVSQAEKLAGVTITGNAETGSSVAISIDGGKETLVNVVNDSWNYKLSTAQLQQKEGTIKITATSTDKAGNKSVAVVKNVDVLSSFGTIAEDGVINAEEKASGVVITGDIKAGSKSVSIQIDNGTAKAATINADGSWSYDLLPSEITGSNLTITAAFTDKNGVVSSETRDIIIDAEATAPTFDSIAENNTISDAEKSEGMTITGTTEIGSTVAISIDGGIEALATVLDGVWNYKIPSAQLKDANIKITATATDKAGNESIPVPTFLAPFFGAIAEDGVINAEEKASGVVITGDIKTGSKAVSIQIDSGTAKPAILKSDGSWSYDLQPSDITGSNLSITATFTDKYGVVSSETKDVIIDAEATAPTIDSIAEDGVISPGEKLDGVTITGTTEIGSTVVVAINGGKETLATVIDGVWNYKLPALQIKEGSLKITATATDKAGNESMPTAEQSVTIEKTNAVFVDITGTNATAYDAGNAKLNFFVSGDNYIYNIVNFAAGDQLNFPAGNIAVKNGSATDRVVDLQYGTSVLHLTGLLLTDAQESAIIDVNTFNSAFGAGSILQ